MSSDDTLAACGRCGTRLIPELKSTPLSLASMRDMSFTQPGAAAEASRQLDILNDEIYSLDMSISSVQKSLELLQQKRHELESSRERYSALFAPVRRLPLEILTKIFSCMFRPGSRSTKVMAKLSLGWVCSQWRAAATAPSELWSTVHVDPVHPWLNPKLLHNVWLPRSGELPLYILLCISGLDKELYPPLLAASHRWRTFHLRDHSASKYRLDTLSNPLHVPQLRSLHLETSYPDERTDYRIRAFVDAPELREVLIQDFPPSRIDLPWDQLETLTARSDTRPSEFRRFFIDCPRLKSLTVILGSVALGSEHIHQETLEMWRFAIPGGNSVAKMLSIVTFPKLTVLEISGRGYDHILWDMPSFMSFLSRSGCHIRSFALAGVRLSNADLLDVLRAMPTIERLSLVESIRGNGAALLTGLTLLSPPSPSSQLPILPMLKDVRFRLYFDALDNKSLVKMVDSRVRSEPLDAGEVGVPSEVGVRRHATLQKLNINLKKCSRRTLAAVDKWKEGGLEVLDADYSDDEDADEDAPKPIGLGSIIQDMTSRVS